MGEPEGSRSFDLSALNEALSQSDTSMKLQYWAGLGFGVLLVGLGSYVAVFQVSPTNSTQVILGVVLVATGVGMAIAIRSIGRKSMSYPTRLEVESDGFRFGSPNANSWSISNWSDGRGKFTLQDATKIRHRSDSKSDPTPFVLLSGDGRRTALPKEAFDLPLREAERHRMRVSSSTWGSEQGRWGALVTFVVESPG
jgi:hypothetical protein